MSFGAARETGDRRPEDRGQSLRDQQKNGRNGGKMGKEEDRSQEPVDSRMAKAEDTLLR
jgi:hypothetical protein